MKPLISVYPNFYLDPYSLREYILNLPDEDWLSGLGGPGIRVLISREEKEALFYEFENILNIKIDKDLFLSYANNGSYMLLDETFNEIESNQRTKVHCDWLFDDAEHLSSNYWAAVIYLTPGAPIDTGTTLFTHKETKSILYDDCPILAEGDLIYYNEDSTVIDKWEPLHTIGNVFNNLVVYNGKQWHGVSKSFGDSKETSRLVQTFFFTEASAKKPDMTNWDLDIYAAWRYLNNYRIDGGELSVEKTSNK